MNARHAAELKAEQETLRAGDSADGGEAIVRPQREQLEAELRLALQRDEFLLHFQPKVSCNGGRILGVEALIRWQHPLRGLVPPGDFIPVLEESELIVAVGEWVLRAACAQTRAWHRAGLGQIVVAVNLSGRQLETENLYSVVKAALDASGLEPAYLELELTESYLVQNPEKAVQTLARLKAIGVRVAVDDFGTGYSSLAYLQRFPLDVIKVDRSFVRDIVANTNDAAITRAVISMAHSLKLDVVAEGVETEAQLGLLIANKCDAVQGHYFSTAVDARTLEQMLREDRRLLSNLFEDAANLRTLLLVDDEQSILELLERVLSRKGYRVLCATDAEQGLRLLGENRVDVIISDQIMPGMSGVEFLRRVKQIHPDSVRMMLSGYSDLKAVTGAINEGAIYKFLSKPWNNDLLLANIEEAFRHKEMAFENRRLSEQLHAANVELVRMNDELRRLLHEKSQQAMRNAAALGAAQEVLQLLPWPYIGIDADGMVAVASADAEALLGKEVPLLGNMAQECLPASLVEWLAGDAPGAFALDLDGARYRVSRRAMGEHSGANGTLLTLEAEGRGT